ncbi:MAG: hypothetical protein J7551_07310 [Chloroflexi bacterium]|nr:hypothetical protein [Chloroflexota bacterium]
MQVRQKLTEFESTIAFVIGGGLILLMLVFGLASASGGSDVSRLNLFLLLGALLLFGGTLVWLFASRPWSKYDDWSEPLYTGHDHDDHSAEVGAERAEAHSAPAETLAHAGAAEGSGSAAGASIAPAAAAASAATEAVAAAPEALAEQAKAQPAPPDDLTIIEGIGPKISGALIAAGVDTFAKLAALQPEEIERIVRGAGVRMVGRAETWAKQAALAAEGKFDELRAYQRTLIAGRSASRD